MCQHLEHRTLTMSEARNTLALQSCLPGLSAYRPAARSRRRPLEYDGLASLRASASESQSPFPGRAWSFYELGEQPVACSVAVLGNGTSPARPSLRPRSPLDRSTFLALGAFFVFLVAGRAVRLPVRADPHGAGARDQGRAARTLTLLVACSLTLAAVVGRARDAGAALLGDLSEAERWRVRGVRRRRTGFGLLAVVLLRRHGAPKLAEARSGRPSCTTGDEVREAPNTGDLEPPLARSAAADERHLRRHHRHEQHVGVERQAGHVDDGLRRRCPRPSSARRAIVPLACSTPFVHRVGHARSRRCRCRSGRRRCRTRGRPARSTSSGR